MHMTNPLVAMNHLFFASILVWFVAQYGQLSPLPLHYGSTLVAQALHYQPNLMPPMLDPEQLDGTFEEIEARPHEVILK